MSKTLEEARSDLQARLDRGAQCPCCGQLAKRYRRKLNSGMAYWLCRLVVKYRSVQGWMHVSEIGQGSIGNHKSASEIGGDLAKLRYWGLIVARPNEDDPTKKDSGYWKPTASGIAFASGKLCVPKYVRVFDGNPLPPEGAAITIYQALNNRFDYQELMRA